MTIHEPATPATDYLLAGRLHRRISPAQRAARWWEWTFALSVVAALVPQLHLAPCVHFNHNDLYHVIQALGLVAFYRAALQLALAPSGP